MAVIQRVVKPRTKRGKRILLKKEPKIIENTKHCVFIPGRKSSLVVSSCMKDLLKLKKPDAVMLTQKNDILPFDDAVQIEKLLQKHDSSLFFFSSHNKKRPNNLVLGRTYDQHILDMFELGIESYKGCSEFKGLSEISAGVKPVLVFLGEQFDSDQQLKRIRNLFIDMFQRQPLKQIRPNGIEHVMSFTAVDSKILLRSYRTVLSKTSLKTPRVELHEVGPSVDFVIRRDHMASADLFKTACKRPNIKGKKIKSVRRDNFGSKLGRLHMTKQDVNTLQTRKMKGLKKTYAERKMKRKSDEVKNGPAIKKPKVATQSKKLKKFSKKGRKLKDMSNIVEIPDPRSPTIAFVRTPLRVVKMIIDEENKSTETRINNELFENALSGNLLVSTPTVSNTYDTDDSFHSAVGENDNEPLISSTNSKGVKGSSKKNRRALGCIKNRLIETPKTDMRRKLWRNMEDERVKKGVNNGVENTPPLPFMDLTASAPPKLYRHRKFT